MQSHRTSVVILIVIGTSFSHPIFSQKTLQTKTVKGILTHPSQNTSDIHIINKVRKKYTISNILGEFKIEAALGDTLKIKGINFVDKIVILTPKVYSKKVLEVIVQEKVNQLKEVMVSKHILTGNIEKDFQNIPITKKRTNTQLGLPESVDNPHEKIVPFRKVFNLGNPFKEGLEASVPITIQLEPLQKHLNGYYKRLKNKRKWVSDSDLVEEVIFFFKKEFISNTYHIKKESVMPFIYYCISKDDTFISNFKNHHYVLILNTFESESKTFSKE